MIDWLLDYLDGRSPRTLAVVSLLLTAIIGVLDFLTGFVISFGVFYLLPVSIASWYVNSRFGKGMSIITAATWLTANLLTEPPSEYSIAVLVWNATTRLGFFLVTSILLVKLKSALAREKNLARTDGLTGLLNSRAFEAASLEEIERARRYLYPLSMIYLDLDDFKLINDREGHASGDRLLAELARILRLNLRSSDIIGRLGGDEFAILLPETDSHAGEKICEKLREILTAGLQSMGWPLTCSMGLVTADGDAQDYQVMLREADRLMYEVKREGKKGFRQSMILSRP